MTLPRYPAYKDSGVEWLGEVPAHWEVTPLKRMLSRNDSGVWGDEPESEYDPIVLRSTEQGVGGEWQIIDPARRKLSKTDVEKSTLCQGDLLVTKSSGSEAHIGKASLVTPEVAALRPCYSNFMQRLRVTVGHSSSFVHFILNNRIAREQMAFLSSSTTGLANLNATVIGQVQVAAPPLGEQAAVVTFLDHETSKIDALIAEQKNLIALLKEKRQAVISHAVTKGLNPDVPMQDSGVEWLGEVPEHWDVLRNKAVFREIDSRSSSGDGELLSVSHLTGVTPRSEKNVNMTMAETLVGYKTCNSGDLVINTMWAWMGALGVSPCEGLVSPSYNVYRIWESQRLDYAYYDYLCRIPAYVQMIKAHSTGVWESRLRLYADAFFSLRIPLPPLEEQSDIATFLAREAAKLDGLVTEADQAISLLQERRSALISAAVTGKIDVRGLVAQEAA